MSLVKCQSTCCATIGSIRRHDGNKFVPIGISMLDGVPMAIPSPSYTMPHRAREGCSATRFAKLPAIFVTPPALIIPTAQDGRIRFGTKASAEDLPKGEAFYEDAYFDAGQQRGFGGLARPQPLLVEAAGHPPRRRLILLS